MSHDMVGFRGEFAASPYAMPWRGWWQVLRRVKREIAEDNLSIVAAGVAFYGFLAVFPAIAAFVLVYGLLADPATVTEQLAPFRSIIPQAAYEILAGQLQQVSGEAEAQLGFGLILSLALALWSASKGVKAMFTALNVAYEEREARSFFWQNGLALLFSIAAVLFVIASLAAITLIPPAIALLQLDPPLSSLLLWSRWVVLAILVMIALALLYRFGPNRRQARLQWVAPGSIAAAILWLLASGLFSFYASNLASYNETFGSLASGVVLLFWFYLSAYVVCLGAELNAELEHQTYLDSTIGPARPRGDRGAYVADHTAEPTNPEEEVSHA